MFLYQEKNGVWYIYYANPKTGNRTTTKKSTKIKSAIGSKPPIKVMQYFVKFQKEFEITKGEGIKSIPMTEFIDMFIAYKKNYISPESLKLYKTDLKQFEKFLNGKVKINEIRQHHIENYLNYLFSKSYAPVNINTIFIIIFQALKFAIKNKFIAKEVDLERPHVKIPQRERPTLSEPEYLKLMDTCKDIDLKDIITAGYMTGMRKSELRNIEWQHVNIDKGFFDLNNTTFLTKNRQMRTIPMNGTMLAMIRRRICNCNESKYVFTYNKKKWTPNTLHIKFTDLIAKTFGENSGITLHSLRRSFATNLDETDVSGFKIQKLLGHSSITTTQIYTQTRTKGLQEAVDKIDIKDMVNRN